MPILSEFVPTITPAPTDHVGAGGTEVILVVRVIVVVIIDLFVYRRGGPAFLAFDHDSGFRGQLE